jgi:hypothetical protein
MKVTIDDPVRAASCRLVNRASFCNMASRDRSSASSFEASASAGEKFDGLVIQGLNG